MSELSRTLIFLGLVFIGVGIVTGLVGKMPGLGRLPGDLVIKKGDFSFYFPVATCLILSVVITLILNFFSRR